MMSNNQTEYTKERKKEERREQRKRKEQRKVQEEHPDYSRSKKQREKNQLAVEEWYLNQIPSIVDFDIELTPSKIEELREYGNMILAGYDFTPKSLRETLLVYQTGKDILHDMYIFREAYRKGRTLQEYKQRLQDYKHGTLAFDIDHEYMLHDKEPVLKSLPLDFGKNFENNIHRECEEESEDSEDEEASSEKANEEGSDSSDEAPSDTETEEELDGGDKHSKEKKTEEESHREKNEMANEVGKDWVIDDYIVFDDQIDWNALDDDSKYDKLLRIANHSRELLGKKIKVGNILCENVATCEWCFKHWHGRENRNIWLPGSEQELIQWSAVFSQTPKDIADVLERTTKTTRVDELAKKLKDDSYLNEAFWEFDDVSSICQYVMHELHPEGVHYYFCHEDLDFQENTTKFDNNAEFIIAIVMETKDCRHFNHYVFDLQKGCCDVKDPTYYETKCYMRDVQYEWHGKVSTNDGIIQ
jgi:hypothetical protein